MNILHLISGRGPTGPAAAAMSDVKSLVAAGHRAFIATRDSTGLMEACTAERVPCVGGLRLGKGPMRILRMPHDVRRLREILRELSIDVLHVHRSDDQLLGATALGHKLSVRLVRTWHRNPSSVPRLLLARLARQADGCICVSRQDVETLNKAGGFSEFIHVGVDTENFAPNPSVPAEKREVRIGQVGRWKRERDGSDRGQCAALDVFVELSRKLSWHGVLIGRGEMAETLRKEAFDIRKLSPERVELAHTPVQSPRDFAKLLGGLSLGLVFRTGGDGTSRAAAELLACGVPLVVADIPGLRELAEESSCALRQLSGDPRGWAHAIEKLIADPARLSAMSVAARDRAVQVHSLKARGSALADFYRRLSDK
jgi:glycosyltransferase involved in cell wall biosynthesis